jgi:ABC-2 type transport system permease protein
MALTLVHTRYLLLQTFRIPIALVGTMFFPAASMLFFVVPFAGDDPAGATLATGSMIVFSTMISCLFGFGVGVAEDRAQPWEAYTRTLPAGPLPRFCGRILSGLVITGLSALPVVVIAAVATEARVSLAGFLGAAAVLVVASIPFTLLGIAIGYAMPTKAALAAVQIIFFPMAFAGGLLTEPGRAPDVIERIAPFLPSRGAVELMWAAVGDFRVDPVATVMLVLWTGSAAVAAVIAYRRDEGRRFG